MRNMSTNSIKKYMKNSGSLYICLDKTSNVAEFQILSVFLDQLEGLLTEKCFMTIVFFSVTQVKLRQEDIGFKSDNLTT